MSVGLATCAESRAGSELPCCPVLEPRCVSSISLKQSLHLRLHVHWHSGCSRQAPAAAHMPSDAVAANSLKLTQKSHLAAARCWVLVGGLVNVHGLPGSGAEKSAGHKLLAAAANSN